MKPNLFYFVSSELSARFPLLPRIKRSFFGLLLFCLVLIMLMFGDYAAGKPVELAVSPVAGTKYYDNIVTQHDAGKIMLGGRMLIEHPSLKQQLLIPGINAIDFFSLFFLAVASLIIIWLVSKLAKQQLFKVDVSSGIWLLAGLMILHALITLYRIVVYIPETVRSLSHNAFTTPVIFPVFLYAEFFFALIILSIGSAYRKGMKLQMEQDLSI